MALEIPRPRPNLFPDVRMPQDSSPESFGGGDSAARAAAAGGQLGRNLEQFHAEKLESALQTAADEAMNRVSAEEARLTLEMRKARGKDAFAAAAKAAKDFDDFRSNQDKEIGNEVVKRYVSQKAGRNRMNLTTEGARWSSSEGERWQDETDQATWENNRNAAIANGSPQRVREAIDDNNRSIEGFARRRGMPPEWVQEQQQKHGSAVHFGVLKTLANSGNDLAAKSYYEANRDSFFGNDAITAAGMIHEGSTLGEAQRQATRIMDAYLTEEDGKPAVGLRDEREAIVEARKIQNAKVQEETVRQIKARFDEKKQADHQYYLQNTQAASNIVEQTGDTARIPVDLRMQLSRTDIKALEDRAADIRKGLNPLPKSDAYLQLVRMSGEDPEKFAQLDFSLLRKKITAEEIAELTKDQAGILKADGKVHNKLESRREDTDFIDTGLKGIGLRETSKLSGDQQKQRETFERAARSAFTLEMIKQDGKPLDNKQREDIIDELQRKVASDGWLFKSDVLGYQDFEKRLSAMMDEIPVEERTKIEAALRARNEPVTRQRIVELYKRMESMDTESFQKMNLYGGNK